MSRKHVQTKTDFDTVDKLIENTFNRLKDVVDANTIIGSTITLSDKVCVIPISKVSVGLISGGGEIPMKKQKKGMSNGCSTSGFTVTPMGFLTINDNNIDYISVGFTESTPTKMIDSLLSIYEKFLIKNGDDNEED